MHKHENMDLAQVQRRDWINITTRDSVKTGPANSAVIKNIIDMINEYNKNLKRLIIQPIANPLFQIEKLPHHILRISIGRLNEID